MRAGRAGLLAALALAALVGGCTGLRPLPRPGPPCATVDGLPALWRCLDAVPREARRESAFASTSRVAKGDLGRKRRDQDPGRACTGENPPGFDPPLHLAAAEFGPGRAPLDGLISIPAIPAIPAVPGSGSGKPIVLVVHGLYESRFTRPARLTAQALAAAGFGVVVPDMRWHGCRFSADFLPTLGLEEGKDLLAWARRLRELHPGRPLGLAAFSLGTLAAVHAAAAPAGAELFDAGVVLVSGPANLARTVRILDAPPYFADRGPGVLTLRYFQSTLRQRMAGLGLDPKGERPFARFLDHLVERAPSLRGYTAARLLAEAEPTARLAAVRRPLLILATADDPVFTPLAAAEWQRAAEGLPNVHLLETEGGGHAGQPGLYPQWTIDVLTRFFAAAPTVPL